MEDKITAEDMKFKALRRKDNGEFIVITNVRGIDEVFTSDLPHPMPTSADIDTLKKYFNDKTVIPNIDIDNLVLVEYDLIESGVVGADIRNALSPMKNLTAMISEYFSEPIIERKVKLKTYIKKEIINSKESIKYISDLL